MSEYDYYRDEELYEEMINMEKNVERYRGKDIERGQVYSNERTGTKPISREESFKGIIKDFRAIKSLEMIGEDVTDSYDLLFNQYNSMNFTNDEILLYTSSGINANDFFECLENHEVKKR